MWKTFSNIKRISRVRGKNSHSGILLRNYQILPDKHPQVIERNGECINASNEIVLYLLCIAKMEIIFDSN